MGSVSKNDDELSYEDLQSLRKFFFWFRIIAGIGIVITISWLGYKNWRWYIAIPVGGITMLLFRIFNRMIRNGLKESEEQAIPKEEQAEKLGTIGFAVPTIENAEEEIEHSKVGFAIPNNRHQSTHENALQETRSNELTKLQLTLIGALFVIFAPSFWYGLGMIINLALS